MKTIFKALPLAVAAIFAASCTWDPNKHDIPAVQEAMVLTASADSVVILEGTMKNEKITFSWTEARQMPDDYYLTYTAKLDVVGNNFGSKTAIVKEYEVGETEVTYSLEQINNWANERWEIPVNQDFYLEFRVIAEWTGGSTFEMPEVKTVRVHVTPIKVIVFNADEVFVAGSVVAVDENLEKCPENAKIFAWSGELSAGQMEIPVKYQGQTFYLAPADDVKSFRDSTTFSIKMIEEPFTWNIPAKDKYRVVVNMQSATAAMYSSAHDLKPFMTGDWYHSGKEANGIVESMAVTNLYLRGESADWSSQGKDLKLMVSPADPQILVYSGAKLKAGRTDFAVTNAFESTKEDGTKNTGNINNAFVFAPLKDISEISGSDWNLGGLKENTPFPMQCGSGAERGGYFKIPAGITFMVFNLRDMTWQYHL